LPVKLPVKSNSSAMLDPIGKSSVILCCGSGGVGKTCVSAALGIHGALSGRKTLVMTIDPARRLADTLGLSASNYEPSRAPDAIFERLGLQPEGELHALIPDATRTFDRIIRRYAASAALADKILSNRYYRHLSASLAGSHEYMAMERLYELIRDDKYDLIIMDTPPSRNALDFLDAPQRLENLLGNNLFRMILAPYVKTGKMGLKVLSFVTSPVLNFIGRLFGSTVLDDLFDFIRLGDELFFEGFRRRARNVQEILSADDTLFYVVSDPMDVPMKEAYYFYLKLREFGMPFGGFIINRVHATRSRIDTESGILEKQIAPGLVEKLVLNYKDWQKLGQSDQKAIRDLAARVGPSTPIVQVPFFNSDIHDFDGLIKIYQHLKT